MSILRFQTKKQSGQKISMVTCYDYPSAVMVAKTAIDCILVGDSVAMTVHGLNSTIHATMEMMVMHTKAVSRGIGKQFLVADLPFMSYRSSLEHTVEHTKSLLQAGAHAVKLEGADDYALTHIRHLVESGAPVMGHIGLQPQSVLTLGGYKIQGKESTQAKKLLQHALKLQEAGCFAIVLECIPSELAAFITRELSIPTIGIGAGIDTDGQVLVWHDLLALQTDFLPKFVKQYQAVGDVVVQALAQYHQEVEGGLFPTLDHSF
jgi:3-methyl-2-oxobutanoate hydroxymethyltransferase